MSLNNQCVSEEIRKYIEANENVNTTFQNLQDATKVILGEVHSDKKQEKSQENDPVLHLRYQKNKNK